MLLSCLAFKQGASQYVDFDNFAELNELDCDGVELFASAYIQTQVRRKTQSEDEEKGLLSSYSSEG